jgi:hypothetical protein
MGAAAVIPAVIGGLSLVSGTLGGIPAGVSKRTMSTLSAPQQYQLANLISNINPQLAPHFKTLAGLGQEALNPYNMMPSYASNFQGGVQIPSQQRQQQMVRQIGDKSHSRSQQYSQQQFQLQNLLTTNELKNQLMLRDLGLKTNAMDATANRKLDALGMMSQSWMIPMGGSIQNYATTLPNYGQLVGQGLNTGATIGLSINQAIKNAQAADFLKGLNTAGSISGQGFFSPSGQTSGGIENYYTP